MQDKEGNEGGFQPQLSLPSSLQGKRGDGDKGQNTSRIDGLSVTNEHRASVEMCLKEAVQSRRLLGATLLPISCQWFVHSTQRG
jgi:hypothetical protein